jgi:hypothetical protein
MRGSIDRNRDLRQSRSEAEGQVESRPFELFDFHEAIIQSGDFPAQQGHRLDLSFFLRADNLFGLLGGALRQTGGDLEPVNGPAGYDFVGQRGGEILH